MYHRKGQHNTELSWLPQLLCQAEQSWTLCATFALFLKHSSGSGEGGTGEGEGSAGSWEGTINTCFYQPDQAAVNALIETWQVLETVHSH